MLYSNCLLYYKFFKKKNVTKKDEYKEKILASIKLLNERKNKRKKIKYIKKNFKF